MILQIYTNTEIFPFRHVVIKLILYLICSMVRDLRVTHCNLGRGISHFRETPREMAGTPEVKGAGGSREGKRKMKRWGEEGKEKGGRGLTRGLLVIPGSGCVDTPL